jgi:D-aminopeptidase
VTDQTTVRVRPLRARELGIPFGGEPGPLDAITDVAGVEVGLCTLISGDGPLRVGHGPVRTGVTAILPRGRDGLGTACTAGWYSLNGNGEMTGTTWISEIGALTTPITISNTHAIGACHTGVVDYVVRHRPDLAAEWLLPVCAETWDGYLNDINGAHVRPEHAVQALEAARSGPVIEGSVGGGTGMNCYGFKGGTGTASRQLRVGAATYTVGVLLQANFGSRHELTVAGVPVGAEARVDNPMSSDWFAEDRRRAHEALGSARPLGSVGSAGGSAPPGAGSVIVVVATDAPLLPGQCTALARRVPLGLARTGTTGSHFSGDIFLAFSTANSEQRAFGFDAAADGSAPLPVLTYLPWSSLDAVYAAVVQAVEEAVLNALVVNADMVGRDRHRSPALPHDELRRLLRAGHPDMRV